MASQKGDRPRIRVSGLKEQIMMFHVRVILGTLVLALAAFGADVSGKWVAKMQLPNGDTRDQTFNLKADGEKLTGTVSSPRGDAEISEGKVNGDEVSFVVVRKFNGEERKIPYKGKVSGDEMKLEMSMGERKMEMTAKKQ